jgi:hypothetical protein
MNERNRNRRQKEKRKKIKKYVWKGSVLFPHLKPAKGKLLPKTHKRHIGGVEVQRHSFLTLALEA